MRTTGNDDNMAKQEGKKNDMGEKRDEVKNIKGIKENKKEVEGRWYTRNFPEAVNLVWVKLSLCLPN
jgi:hypothetical protein